MLIILLWVIYSVMSFLGMKAALHSPHAMKINGYEDALCAIYIAFLFGILWPLSFPLAIAARKLLKDETERKRTDA